MAGMKSSPNTLDILLKAQSDFMIALGISPFSGDLISNGTFSKSEMGAAIGISVEAAEILELVDKAGRYWKDKGDTVAEVKKELIDVVFFTLELAVLLGLTGDDLTNLYRDKYRFNLTRLFKSKTSKGESIEPFLLELITREFSPAEVTRMFEENTPKR